jgi:hypothetical protein
MAGASYQVVDIDLSVIGDAIPIRSVANARIAFVGILAKPAGLTTPGLRFGSGGAVIPFSDFWTGLDFCPPHDQGVYVYNPAASVGTIKLLFSFDQGGA